MAGKRAADMGDGQVFKMNLGNSLVIKKYERNNKVHVEFLDTGYRTITTVSALRVGSVIDKMHPRSFGVGFIGCGPYITNKSPRNILSYDRWRNMLKRCYDKEYHKVKPTYKDCTVCEEWHNFQNFAKWFHENYPDDGKLYHLDKDMAFNGNKLYSPETCQFLTPFENSQISHQKKYTLINPEGEIVHITNLSKYCRENNINRGGLKALFSGGTKCYKGWRLP